MINWPHDYPTRTDKAWAGLALLVGGVGAMLLVAACTVGGDRAPALIALGLAQLGVGGNFLWRRIKAGLRRPRLTPTPRGLVLSEILLLVTILPYAALLLWMGVIDAGVEMHAVAGRPAEVRSDSRTVHMADGRVYTYACSKDDGRRSGTCPAEARWDALPRWPEPKRVEMLVAGSRIRSLVMDGVVIVEPSEFRTDDILKRVLLLLAGAGGAAQSGFSIRRRMRRLSEARRPEGLGAYRKQ